MVRNRTQGPHLIVPATMTAIITTVCDDHDRLRVMIMIARLTSHGTITFTVYRPVANVKTDVGINFIDRFVSSFGCLRVSVVVCGCVCLGFSRRIC